MIHPYISLFKQNGNTKSGKTDYSHLAPEINLLWVQYSKKHDELSREKLLAHYSYLVRLVLSRMKVNLITHLDKDDMESAGIISLIQSLDRFDLNRGVKFETFAYRRIQGGILDYLRQIDYLSRSSRERVKKYKLVYEKLREKKGLPPHDDEIMREMHINEKELKQIYFEISCDNPISLEAGFEDNESDHESKSAYSRESDKEVPVLDQMIKTELINQVTEVIDKLPERDRLLISLYYYEDLTFKEIGDIFQVSESRICQMHTKVLCELQSQIQLTIGTK